VTYGKLSVTRNFDFVAGGFSKNLGLEYVHNFGVMAQVLLIGENRFLPPCDFKELRVIKSTLYNFYVSGFTTFFEQHSANRSLRERVEKTSTYAN
jgi:hypothetical protein